MGLECLGLAVLCVCGFFFFFFAWFCVNFVLEAISESLFSQGQGTLEDQREITKKLDDSQALNVKVQTSWAYILKSQNV